MGHKELIYSVDFFDSSANTMFIESRQETVEVFHEHTELAMLALQGQRKLSNNKKVTITSNDPFQASALVSTLMVTFCVNGTSINKCGPSKRQR